MIVATAGHVDHGKTLLVRALTGVDTDRLPEEKKRQMTIDLGFAYLPAPGAAPGEAIGFVDVPGHERFVRNMLCGVAGIDFVLFVVAADDGPMPQTREHLAILDLLGVAAGAAVITKADRVPPARAAAVAEEVRALLAPTPLAGAPAFAVSALTGEGMDALRRHLAAARLTLAARRTDGNFRLAIDRCFTVVGAGLVVTGTAVSGTVRAGDAVRLLSDGQEVRVRAIRAHDAPADGGHAGQRLALNLAGPNLDKDRVARGDWIVAGPVPGAARKIDARLRVLETESRPLAHWTPVHVHLGAAEATGRIAVLEGGAIAPGGSALVQLVLDRPIGALAGDRFVVRDQSAQRTLGGGRVIDVFPPARGRARPDRLAFLAAMETADHAAALARLLDEGVLGIDLARFGAARNLTPEESTAVFGTVAMTRVRREGIDQGFAPCHWDSLRETVLAALADWHRRHPGVAGVSEDRLAATAGLRLPAAVALAVAGELARAGTIAREGRTVHLPAHRAKMEPADAARWKRVAPLLQAGGVSPPAVGEIALKIGEPPPKVEQLLVRAGRLGLVVRISPNRFLPPAALQALAEKAEALAAAAPGELLTVIGFREGAGIGRNLAVEVLEHFDRIKLTRRIGDGRKLLRPAAGLFQSQ
ncbi:MAG: selenocysteine-specific translation elongation factor [Rhodospirillales bacterium]